MPSGRIVALKIGELHREEADFILAQIQAVDRADRPAAGAGAASSRLRELAVSAPRRNKTAVEACAGLKRCG